MADSQHEPGLTSHPLHHSRGPQALTPSSRFPTHSHSVPVLSPATSLTPRGQCHRRSHKHQIQQIISSLHFLVLFPAFDFMDKPPPPSFPGATVAGLCLTLTPPSQSCPGVLSSAYSQTDSVCSHLSLFCPLCWVFSSTPTASATTKMPGFLHGVFSADH